MVGAVRQQAITRANVDRDLCCHMASLGHNELNVIIVHAFYHLKLLLLGILSF